MMYDFQPGDALLIVDAQNDFFPGGALGVTGGDKIIPILNEMITLAQQKNIPIIFSRDWHPPDHCSFQDNGGPWPTHCIQNTTGAAFHPDVQIPSSAIIIDKGHDSTKEAYSAYAGRDHEGHQPLPDRLSDLGITRLWVSGLALDYCVKFTALDAVHAGYDIKVVLDATAAIDTKHQNEVLEEIERGGGHLVGRMATTDRKD